VDLPFHLFDRDRDVLLIQRSLPHWSQAGAISFITWRTHDSLPQRVLDNWHADRNPWLLEHGIDPGDPSWRQKVERLDDRLARQFFDQFWNRWHDNPDAGHGACE
jgi:putative transposase